VVYQLAACKVTAIGQSQSYTHLSRKKLGYLVSLSNEVAGSDSAPYTKLSENELNQRFLRRQRVTMIRVTMIDESFPQS
jgi:hypothetical protein